MKLLVISSSLNLESRSKQLAQAIAHRVDAEFLDLATHTLPICDGGPVYSNEEVISVKKIIEAADGIILATPVYSFNASASAKNLIELTQDAWKQKVVGFICAAGGGRGYMSIMGLANSLMLDFRCIIIPRFVFASRTDFPGGDISDEGLNKRLDGLAEDLKKFTKALR